MPEGPAIDVAIGLAVVLLLILLNGFYVLGEFSLVAADRSKTEADAAQGNRRAASTLRALKELSHQLSGAQLGITVTSLLVGFVLEPTVGNLLRPLVEAVGVPAASSLKISLTVALLIATAFQMVLGELVPKNLALARPLEMAYAVSGPLRLSNLLFRPVIVFLNAAANGTVRLLGIEPREELVSIRSRGEIQQLIHESRAMGALTQEEFSLLARSISFADKVAADALVPRFSVRALSMTANLDELAELSRETGHSRLPVFESDLDDVVGVAHVKDIYAIAPQDRRNTPVAAIMQDPLVTPESRPLDDLLIDMRRARRHIAVVVDEYGGTAGIVTFEDLLEEIVGEIEDEHDKAGRPQFTPSYPPGVYVVPGLLHPDELREQTGFSLPEGDYETLAGFLLSRFDHIPQEGDHLSHDDWEFKVIAMDGRRIAEVLIVAPQSTGSTENGTTSR